MTRSTSLINSANMNKDRGKNIWNIVKVSHSKSSHKINIPIEIARATGIDKIKHVLIIKKGDQKLEIKKYGGPEDLKEYI